MTLVVDTERVPSWKIEPQYSSSGEQGWYVSNLEGFLGSNKTFKDVIVVYHLATIETDFTPKDLTYLASQISEASFAEAWNNEDDNYWDSYL